MKKSSMTFSGSFGPEGFFRDIFERVGPDAGMAQWQKAVSLLKVIQALFEKYLKELGGDDVEATRRTLEDFYNIHDGQRLLDELAQGRLPQQGNVPEKGDGVLKPPAGSGKPNDPSPVPPERPQDKPNKKKKNRREKGMKRGKLRSKPIGGRKSGLGNRKISSFAGADKLLLQLPKGMQPGCRCPDCKTGTLWNSGARDCLRFVEKPILSPLILELQKVRCGDCNTFFEAEMPQKYSKDEVICKATAGAMAASCLMRYGLGFPDHRLETLQNWQGAFFSDANRWTISRQIFDELAGVQKHLCTIVANAELREVDDCSVRVIELRKQIEVELEAAAKKNIDAKSVRTGINVTSYVAQYQGETYRLFQIGREHQGEREYEMSLRRESQKEPVVRVSDAASKGKIAGPFPRVNNDGFVPVRKGNKGSPETTLAASVIEAFCLEHLRDTVENAAPGFRIETDILLGLLSKVFENDAAAVCLSPQERMEFHCVHSAPLLESFLTFVHSQLRENIKAEPNHEYRKALNYALNHWDGFTQFLRTPGIPLTTSRAELANKFSKRHHRNSLAFQTAAGANVGAFFMSLIATAEGCGENPLNYLTAIIRYRKQICEKNAHQWMPQCYKDAIPEAEKRMAESENPDGYRTCHRQKTKKKRVAVHKKSRPGPKTSQTAAASVYN